MELNCVRVINEENARLVKQGREETKIQMIINMLKNNLTDAQIKAISGISDKELERIKQQANKYAN